MPTSWHVGGTWPFPSISLRLLPASPTIRVGARPYRAIRPQQPARLAGLHGMVFGERVFDRELSGTFCGGRTAPGIIMLPDYHLRTQENINPTGILLPLSADPADRRASREHRKANKRSPRADTPA